MNNVKSFCSVLIGTLFMLSCMDSAESYQAGIATLRTQNTYRFSNTPSDTLYVASYGNWNISRLLAGGEWCQPEFMRGYGYIYYSICLKLEPNLSGSARAAAFHIADDEHADEAYADFSITQLATRGDGSLGNAPLVKAVKGTDGSEMAVGYDELCRPLKFSLSKNGTLLRNLNISYDDSKNVMTVDDNGTELTATYTNDFQPYVRLTAPTDTIELTDQGLSFTSAGKYAFNIEHRSSNGQYDAFAYLTASLDILRPDQQHNADSLRYISGNKNGVSEKLFMKPTYSNKDNRCQSLDVNQLLLGVERCNPYLLLSLFRAARNTQIYDEVQVEDGTDIRYNVSLNADKSVSKLKVTQGSNVVTYEFEY